MTKKKSATSILDYNYKFCNTPFVGRDSAMVDLDAFMADKKYFLWYVVYGEAGAGKSRLALELCKKYKEQKWECGFINWGRLSKDRNIWEEWMPKHPTLIVVDYAKSYLRNRPSSGNENQGTNSQDEGFPDLVSALEILMGNADKFENPVRFLLLERGQEVVEQEKTPSPGKDMCEGREQDKMQDPDLDLFHVQLMAEEAELRLCFYNERKPLFLESLENDDALQTLALNVFDNQWPAYCEPKAFIESLKKFDAKKRPLFVIILACRLKTPKHERASMGEESILQESIKEIFSSTKYQGLCRGDIYLLMLATMCGGLHSLPKTKGIEGISNDIILPDVWADGDLCRKYLNWGFAKKATNEHGREVCTIFPIVPDLIGEFFVLEGFNHIKTSTGARNMPLNTLQDMALIAWHHVSHNTEEARYDTKDDVTYKLLSFFSRCGGDFANKQLKDVVLFLLESFQKIPTEHLKHNFCLDWATLAVDLVNHYGTADKMEHALNIFDAMATLRDHQDFAIQRAKASVYLISIYGRTGYLVNAQKIFDAMAALDNLDDLGEYQDIAIERARASSNLIHHYGNDLDFEKAEKVFKAMDGLGKHQDIAILRAKASFNMIFGYCCIAAKTPGSLERAQEILDALNDLGVNVHNDIAKERAEASADLMNAYYKAGTPDGLQKALKIHEVIAADPHFKSFETQVTKQDQNICEALVALGDHQNIAIKYARASTNLIFAYGNVGIAGELEKAQKVFEAMADLGEHDDITNARAEASVYLIKAYAKAGTPDDLGKAQKIREDMASNPHFKSFEAKINEKP